MRVVTVKKILISCIAFQVGGITVCAIVRFITELILWNPSDLFTYSSSGSGAVLLYVLLGDLSWTLGVIFGSICGYVLAYLSGTKFYNKKDP